MQSLLRNNAARTLCVGVVACVLVAAVRANSAITRAGNAHKDQLNALSKVIDLRTEALASLATKTAEFTRLEQSSLMRLDDLADGSDSMQGCVMPAPGYKYGVGILQVAGVPANRGDDTVRFAANQITRLRTLFAADSIPSWSEHLSQYLGRGAQPVRRVVFNDIDPTAGAELCAWLRCQKWTGGCGFIDERGEMTPPSGSPEYAPTEDLYQQWKVSSAEPRAPTAPKL